MFDLLANFIITEPKLSVGGIDAIAIDYFSIVIIEYDAYVCLFDCF